MNLAATLANTVGVQIEFTPEPMGSGPRQHMMFAEPGGLRIELLWAGEWRRPVSLVLKYLKSSAAAQRSLEF